MRNDMYVHFAEVRHYKGILKATPKGPGYKMALETLEQVLKTHPSTPPLSLTHHRIAIAIFLYGQLF